MDETRNLPLVQDIILDMTESQQVVIYANQYDEDSRTVRCHIQDKGIDFDCSGYIINLLIKKSNGYGIKKEIGKDGFGSVNKNIITFPILIEMTYSHGRQEWSLEFVKNNKTVNSCANYLRVNERPVKKEDMVDDRDDYSSVYDDINKMKSQIDSVSNDIFNEVARAKDVESNLVPITRTIAGIKLVKDISSTELKNTLKVPSKNSELENDSGYITKNDISINIKSDIKPTTDGKLGDIVYNSNPVSSDYIGWVYTLSGWFGFGKIEIVSNGIELSDESAFILSDGTLFLTADE